MVSFKTYLDWDEPYFKGSYIELPCIVTRDLSDCEIRVSIFDEFCNEVKLATVGIEGGSDSQVEITQDSGEFDFFTVKVPYDSTRCFGDRIFVEVELQDEDGNRFIILKRRLDLKPSNLNWDTL